MANKRMRLIIKGRVQGVWFRDSTRTEAKRLGVKGWVRNLPDRSVEVVAEADENLLGQLLVYCRQGPPHAKVDKIEESWEEWSGEFDSFNIVF